MMKKWGIGMLLACTMAAAAFGYMAEATDAMSLAVTETHGYASVLAQYEMDGVPLVPPETSITLTPADAVLSGAASPATEEGRACILSPDADNTLRWTVTIDTPGLYEIHVDYLALEGTGAKIQRSLHIDGTLPFEEAANLCLYRRFYEEETIRINSIGDEVWPKQYELPVWQSAVLVDGQGLFVDPLLFYLDAGEHTLTLGYVDEPVAIAGLTLRGRTPLPAYAEALAGWQAHGATDVPETVYVKWQAEDTAYRSDSVIRRESNADPKVEPFSLTQRVLNTLGGYRWRVGNQAVTWTFSVPESGLYTLHLKVGQNTDAGMPAYRQIAIDGQIPFDEMRLYAFPYDRIWYGHTLSGEDGAPYRFYLEAGEHTLTLTAKLGPLADVMRMTTEDVQYLSAVMREIIKITGTEPDFQYEYDLYRVMPALGGQLTYLADRLEESAARLAAISNETTSMENNYRQIIDQLRFFAEDVDRIPRALSDMDNAQTNLGTYINTLEKSPLVLDYLAVSAPSRAFEVEASTFAGRAKVTGANFIASFSKDYDSVGLITAEDEAQAHTVLDVWMARGTEWGEVVKELADELFTPETGIIVNLHVVPAGQLATGSVNTIMLAVASGTAPDVCISVDYTLPGEFAFRDAAVDLSQYDDFAPVAGQFYPSSLTPYQYGDGVYALPETMDFTVLLYRRDILAELGVPVPETWTELYQAVLPKLYEQNMAFSFPVDTSVSANSPNALRGFTLLLLQNGGTYYHGGGAGSALDTPEAYRAFKFWTDMYRNYGIDAESNFFTRIRTGTMPIGIANFATYLSLITSAPELYGQWTIAPVPGTVQADGSVSHAIGTTASTANIILSQSEKQDAAWAFLKWWMSEETQIRYGRELEAIMGEGARWNTANVEAFLSLPWNRAHLEVIQAQMAVSQEQPIVPGGYFTGRHIINAWNRVIINHDNARDSLEEAVKDINKELTAKRIEFGLE